MKRRYPLNLGPREPIVRYSLYWRQPPTISNSTSNYNDRVVTVTSQPPCPPALAKAILKAAADEFNRQRLRTGKGWGQ